MVLNVDGYTFISSTEFSPTTKSSSILSGDKIIELKGVLPIFSISYDI